MSDAFYMSLPATIAAVGGMFAAWAALRQTKVTAKTVETQVGKTDVLVQKVDIQSEKADIQADKTEKLTKKADEIHILTNGTNHQLTADLRVANEKIVGLEKTLAASSQTALEKIAGLEKMVARILANGDKEHK